MTYLLEQVQRICQHRHIRPEHVFFGGEDVNCYSENFVNSLRASGWLVANVNARDAKNHRDNLKANMDRLDLMGIAATLLNRRANCCPAQLGVYRNLRTLVVIVKNGLGQDPNTQPDPHHRGPALFG